MARTEVVNAEELAKDMWEFAQKHKVFINNFDKISIMRSNTMNNNMVMIMLSPDVYEAFIINDKESNNPN